MKIREVQFFRAVSPLSRPIADATHQIPEIAFIVTRILGDNGITGESYLLAFHYSPLAIFGALRDIRELVLGWDVSVTNEDGGRSDLRSQMGAESEYFGVTGINSWAIGAVEIAMWDAHARSLGCPVYQFWNGKPRPVPLYGSGGWLSYSTEELVDEVAGYVKRGFRAVKVKVGSNLSNDLERLTKVKEAVGPDVNIMIDANQGLSPDSAIQLAKAVQHLGIDWFEEPVSNVDFDGYRQVHDEAGMKLAMGEREYNTVALRELIRRAAIDLWQPDILRLGGAEAWVDSARIAEQHGLPVLPHFYKEYDVPLLMTVKHAYGAESFDWVDPLIDKPLRMEGGMVYPHTEPGWGFRFKDECLSEIRL